MAHTPGPWEWNQDSRWPRCLMAPRGAPGALSMVRVAEIYYIAPDDATLIAASPDLRRFAQEIAALDPQDFDADMGETLIRRARALVVKADGAT